MSDEQLTVGSLFAGIGGIDLGLERTGHFRTVWFCERDEFCQRVLAKHWPEVPCFDDVADIGADVASVDVLTAGFPCQPVSLAGQRLAQDDERWLWPHVDRLIRLLRPRIVILENVTGLLSAGFDDVIGGLAACRYDAEWDCIPAGAFGAPHRRDRMFLVAYPASDGQPEQRIFRRLSVTPQEAWQTTDAVNALATGSLRVVCGEHDGFPDWVDALRSLGNAVVPQVAEHIGYSIAEAWGMR